MRKFLPSILLMPLFICGCVGMSTTDGSSTKQWISIVSSKSDLDGSTADVCYKLNLRFNPAEAEYRIDTDRACITRCCWYSENKSVQMDFNAGFADDLVEYGAAKKYEPEILTVNVSYSPFLKTIHAKAEQKGVIKSDGVVQLEYDQVTKPEQFLDLDFGTQTAKLYRESDTKQGTYLFAPEKKPDTTPQIYTDIKTDEEEPDYNEISDSERQELLKKKLSYERRQAVLLLKRFYNKEIDSYILAIDKAKRAQGLVLMSNDRDWTTVKIGTPIYKVTCKVNGKLGKTPSTMKDFPISCGSYEVNLDEKTVTPIDTAAISIVNGEYMN
ncbi:hypothetical protein [Candidatus Proelusimicrobium volucris]|uniref:hypothetical protein n=1 Tax=Candidatus Proelusimicrobium volucris TaxID=3416225 RepID=UPI003D0ED37D